MQTFREYHLLKLLRDYDQQQGPIDFFISQYFKANRALGSKDRGVIAEQVYGLVRWKVLLDFLCESPVTWEKRLALYNEEGGLEKYLNRDDIPENVRVSFPRLLFDLIVDTHGKEKAYELCLASNKAAPTTVRVNTLKTTRETMLASWKEQFEISPCLYAPNGITFHKKLNFFVLPEFKNGLFEVQDEGSQILADLIQAQPGQQVMDYCSGSGGKTLAFAPRMQNRGQIFLHDIRPRILIESRKRLKRAGIQNAQVVQEDDPKLKKLKKRMDWVLVDAPCSGTGTMRRNPDMKEKFDGNALIRLVGQQRVIFEKALSYLHPKGHIVYATCSILREENQAQVEHFLQTYDLELVSDPFQSFPTDGGMDGFFGAVFRFVAPQTSQVRQVSAPVER